MPIDISVLRAAGLTAEQIVSVVEADQRLRLERRREQNRINQQNHRRAVSNVSNVINVSNVSADTPPPLDGPPSPNKEKSPTPPKEINPHPPLNPPLPKETRVNALWPIDYREQFWRAYPHKVGKPAAIKSLDKFAKARDGPAFADLMSGLHRYAAKNDDRPWCNPATWLNQQRWTDEPAKINGYNHAKPKRKSVHDVLDDLDQGTGPEADQADDRMLPFGGRWQS